MCLRKRVKSSVRCVLTTQSHHSLTGGPGQWLDGQAQEEDLGKKKRGRKLSDSGAKARFYHAVCEAHLGNIIKVDLTAGSFSYAIDEAALRPADLMDGKLLVVINMQDMTPDKVIERYKSLADIKRGFKVLKKWPRLFEQLSPIYKWSPGGLGKMQSCTLQRATRGASAMSFYAASASLGSMFR